MEKTPLFLAIIRFFVEFDMEYIIFPFKAKIRNQEYIIFLKQRSGNQEYIIFFRLKQRSESPRVFLYIRPKAKA